MSNGSLVAKDFLNMESGKIENEELTLCLGKDNKLDYQQDKRLNSFDDSNPTHDLFKKYRPLERPTFNNGLRRPTLLERALLPIRSGDGTTPNSSSDKSSKDQLTIFYGGVVHVYNNVPFDKAQAIMLLAGESSVSTPTVGNKPKKEVIKKKPKLHNHPRDLPSISKLQADLPIARKFSLQRFLEKRHRRITSKSPYPSSETRHDDDGDHGDDKNKKTTKDYDLNEKGSSCLALSPFPSRLGNSFFMSANNGC